MSEENQITILFVAIQAESSSVKANTIVGKYVLFTYVEHSSGRSKVSIRRFPVPNVLEDFGAVSEEDHFVKEMRRHVVHAPEPHGATARRPPLHL